MARLAEYLRALEDGLTWHEVFDRCRTNRKAASRVLLRAGRTDLNAEMLACTRLRRRHPRTGHFGRDVGICSRKGCTNPTTSDQCIECTEAALRRAAKLRVASEQTPPPKAPDWHARAVCGHLVDWWKGPESERAEVCQTCPVRGFCDERHDIRSALTA